MPKNRESGTLVFVTISIGAGLKYGFRSRLRDSLRDNFGQIIITGTTSLDRLVIGCDLPKPARASKRSESLGYEGSFCSTDKVASLRADKYRITSAKLPKLRGGAFAATMYATVNGLKVATVTPAPFDTEARSQANYPTQYGMNLATQNDVAELVYSPDFPQLPNYSYTLSDGSVFSADADPSKVDEFSQLLDAGFKENFAGYYTQEHLKARYSLA